MKGERNIKIEFVNTEPIEEQEIEIVERKGLGHPDSLCDGIAEAVSVALCHEYKKKCGMILHHNADKTQIVAGRSNPRYGGGEVISPIYILLGGRATKEFGGKEFATDTIAIKATKEYLRNNITNLDVDSHVVVDCKLGKGSSDLLSVFIGKSNEEEVETETLTPMPIANDTSFGVAHAPLSETETIVLNVENLTIQEYRKKEKAIGEDMKVMALRQKNKIMLTVADAFVSQYVDDYEHYACIKKDLNAFIGDIAPEYTSKEVSTMVNTADRPDSVYITVTGTSAEMGDDGAAGRGNRCNGLITPNRPMSMEGTSGKNPVNHTGKLYNLVANKIANEIVETVEGIEEVYIKILSEIGRRIDDPRVANVHIIPKESNVNLDAMEKRVHRITDDWLSDIGKITEMVVKGELKTF
jgi:S-adenosylmethionine synthetase